MSRSRSIRIAVARSAKTFVGAALVMIAAAGWGEGSRGSVKETRTLTSVKQAHELTASEADRAYPVHLRGVITFYDPWNDSHAGAMFLQDATGGIYVMVPANTRWPDGPPPAGTLVEVDAITAPGDYASLLVQPRFKVLGRSSWTVPAKRVTLTQLLTGREDSQWVEIEGIVQSVVQGTRRVTLDVAMPDGVISANTVIQPGMDYKALVDSKILLRGAAAVLFNHDRQMTGFRLKFPGMSSVTVEDAGPTDPFRLPVHSIDSLSRFDPRASLFHRVHLAGTVTLQVPGKRVCLEEDQQALCAQSEEAGSLRIGDRVDMVGFSGVGSYKPTLVHAMLRLKSRGVAPAATKITAQDALSGNYDSKLVKLTGKVIGYDLTAKNPTLLMESQGAMFPVVLPVADPAGILAAVRSGSEMSISGICEVEVDAQKTAKGDGAAAIRSFRMTLRSPDDLVLLKGPSWWTAGHALDALGFSVFVAVAVLCWVFVLRRRVNQQTKMLRQSEEQFRHMAQHDALTGLPTRLLLHDRMEMALERMKRYKSFSAVLMLDLDNFKKVNDSFGHHAGDLALRTTAHRILETIRKTDTAARMGGDEFVVLLTDLKEVSEAEAIAQKIMVALARPVTFQDHQFSISASIGVCPVEDAAMDPESLLKQVDAAMYHAKSQGRNRCQVFTSDLAAAVSRRLQIQVALGRAIHRKELEVYYQPLVISNNGEVGGVEALLRWRSEELGMVMPGDFIPVAEESGLIVPIGEWVLEEANRQIAEMERRIQRSLMLAVNLSPRQLLHPGLVAAVSRAISVSGRDPGNLILEITEGTLMSDSNANRETLVSLRGLGVQLAIDDFGIGFSSLSYITQFAADWIKIDRSLIQNCTSDRASLAVLRAIVAMARGLEMRVVAEGIETEEQFQMLKDEQCDVAQGFYLARPMPGADLGRFLGVVEEPVEDADGAFSFMRVASSI